MARVYLETSFVSACVTTRAGLRSAYEREVSRQWWHSQASGHDLYVSDEVLAELSRPEYPRRDEALWWIERVPVISISDEMVRFAEALVERMVMPRPVAGDSLHVATAVVAGMDVMLTWNVKHLANPNKVLHLNAVCAEFGFVCPRILRPDDLTELEP